MRSFITCTLHQILLRCQVKGDEVGGTCSTHVEMRSAYKILVGKSEGKRPLGRPRRKYEDDIKMDFKEIG